MGCVGAFATTSRFQSRSDFSQPAGNSPRISRSNFARFCGSSTATRASHPTRSSAPRRPASRHAARIGAGTTKRSCGQPRNSRAAFASSSNSLPPWATRWFSMRGTPKPIKVLHLIIDGRGSSFAAAIAAAIASWSCPSHSWMCQPAQAKRTM